MEDVIIRIKKLPGKLMKEWRERYDSVSCRWEMIADEFRKLEVAASPGRPAFFFKFKTFSVSVDELLAAIGRRSQEVMLDLSQALEGCDRIVICGRYARVIRKPAFR